MVSGPANMPNMIGKILLSMVAMAWAKCFRRALRWLPASTVAAANARAVVSSRVADKHHTLGIGPVCPGVRAGNRAAGADGLSVCQHGTER